MILSTQAHRVQPCLTPEQQALVDAALPFAWHQAGRWAAHKAMSANSNTVVLQMKEQLASAAIYGLCLAAVRFEPARGFKFLTYAGWYVRREIQMELRNLHPVSPNWTEHSGIHKGECPKRLDVEFRPDDPKDRVFGLAADRRVRGSSGSVRRR